MQANVIEDDAGGSVELPVSSGVKGVHKSELTKIQDDGVRFCSDSLHRPGTKSRMCSHSRIIQFPQSASIGIE